MVKAKTAAKSMTFNSSELKKIVLDTVSRASTLVGSTLGPNGKVVLIERQENLPPFTTKDGITVFNSMSFADPTAQAVLEVARDSSSKTNTEAGDGTTTATILAESLIRRGFNYLELNPQLSPQKIMRDLEDTFNNVIEPFIKESSLKIKGENAEDLLRKVATIATNNDTEMTAAVLKCFSMVGHNGNITVAESPGSSGFSVERVEGFPIAIGFEETAGRWLEEFINDKGNYRIQLERPWFILYNGKLNDLAHLLPVIGKLGQAYEDAVQRQEKFSPNVVVVAHHFSDQVLSALAANMKDPSSLNVVPLRTMMTQQANSPYHFLVDLAAFTGAAVFDPATKPLESATLNDLGLGTMDMFESYRYRSVVFGKPEEMLIIARTEELEQQSKQAESILDGEILRERMAILTGGIARLKVLGSSEAELKEKRHRVEDAVASIKGALKYGALPGGGKTLLTLRKKILEGEGSDAVKAILAEALQAPFLRLLDNGGYNINEIKEVRRKVMYSYIPSGLQKFLVKIGLRKARAIETQDFFWTYDALNRRYGNAIEIGVLDSASAVLMAIKNSLSVAKMLMTLSGIVVFKRDFQHEAAVGKDFAVQQQVMEEAVQRSYKEQFEPPM